VPHTGSPRRRGEPHHDVVRATVGLLAQEARLVPEPTSLALLAIGALLLRRRLGRRTAA
jgi:hypothetical protein